MTFDNNRLSQSLKCPDEGIRQQTVANFQGLTIHSFKILECVVGYRCFNYSSKNFRVINFCGFDHPRNIFKDENFPNYGTREVIEVCINIDDMRKQADYMM